MSWTAVIVAGGAIGGGLISANASRKAAGGQDAASEAAIAEQRRQFDLNRSDLAPWRTAGTGAIGQLSNLTGTGGALNKRFTVQDFLDDPVTKLSFQTGLDRGTQALDRMAGARGSRNSGAQLKALTQFGTDYGGTKAGESYGRFYGDQDRQFNRLAAIAGVGQTATNAGVTAGSNSANQISNILTAQGNARGAASIAQGNAYSGGLGTIGQWYNQQNILNQLNQNRQPQQQQLYTDNTGAYYGG